MLWVIDPDVYTAALVNPACNDALRKIVSRLHLDHFAVDNKTIKREYTDFFTKYYESKPDHPGIEILARVLNLSGNCQQISSDYTAYQAAIDALGCIEAVEPHLLAVVARSEMLSPILVLPGAGAAMPRKRGLHDPAILRKAKKCWPWLDVRDACETQISLQPPVREQHAKKGSGAFESLAALALQDQDPQLRCKQPPPIKKYGREIDVFGEKKVDGVWVIVVGECKLREEGNEAASIEYDDIKQVDEQAQAVEKYYRTVRKVNNFRVERYIISNADNFDSAAKRKAQDLARNGHPVQFWQAKLTSGWSRRERWRIKSLALLNISTT